MNRRRHANLGGFRSLFILSLCPPRFSCPPASPLVELRDKGHDVGYCAAQPLAGGDTDGTPQSGVVDVDPV